MPRTEVKQTDLVAAIVTALNGVTVNGGVVKAVANGHTVNVFPHTDALGGAGKISQQIDIQIR